MGPQGLPWSARRPRGRAPIVPTSIKISVNDTKSCKSVNLKIRGHFPYILYVFAMDAMTYFSPRGHTQIILTVIKISEMNVNELKST